MNCSLDEPSVFCIIIGDYSHYKGYDNHLSIFLNILCAVDAFTNFLHSLPIIDKNTLSTKFHKETLFQQNIAVK